MNPSPISPARRPATIAPFQTLFLCGEDDVVCYRIPALIRARNGDLVAVADARYESWADLNGGKPIDIVIRRSSDGGATWTPMAVLSDLPEGFSGSDPSLLLDRETGSLFCFYNVWDNLNRPGLYQQFVQESRDNGKTWGKPRDLTPSLRRPGWPEMVWAFITSGHGCQLADGTLLHTMTRVDTKEVSLFGSRDHGKSWEPIGTCATPGDENKVVELPDGGWMINTRVNGEGCRWSHVSRDGGETWVSKAEPVLVDPSCNAAIERDGDRLYFCNANSATERKRLTVRVSLDGGKSWSEGRLIEPGISGYSDVAVLSDGTLGIFYETVVDDKGALVFTKLTL